MANHPAGYDQLTCPHCGKMVFTVEPVLDDDNGKVINCIECGKNFGEVLCEQCGIGGPYLNTDEKNTAWVCPSCEGAYNESETIYEHIIKSIPYKRNRKKNLENRGKRALLALSVILLFCAAYIFYTTPSFYFSFEKNGDMAFGNRLSLMVFFFGTLGLFMLTTTIDIVKTQVNKKKTKPVSLFRLVWQNRGILFLSVSFVLVAFLLTHIEWNRVSIKGNQVVVRGGFTRCITTKDNIQSIVFWIDTGGRSKSIKIKTTFNHPDSCLIAGVFPVIREKIYFTDMIMFFKDSHLSQVYDIRKALNQRRIYNYLK